MSEAPARVDKVSTLCVLCVDMTCASVASPECLKARFYERELPTRARAAGFLFVSPMAKGGSFALPCYLYEAR